MAKIMFFDTMVSGHHLEYLHHLHEGTYKEKQYIFIVPESFKSVRNNLNWSLKTNIYFDYIPQSIIDNINNCSHLKKSIELSSTLKKYWLIYKPEKIFLISLIDFYPFLPLFFLKSFVDISGIIYKIYLYEWETYNLFQKCYECIRQACMVYSKCTHKIFILNDPSSTTYLNKIWKTNKYFPLVDPYIPINEDNVNEILLEYNIQDNNIVYLHWGAMEKRKGTLDILDAIDLLEENGNRVFIFAGKIFADIAKPFYEKYNVLKNRHRIIVIDRFCEYELICALNKRSNCILLPYKKTSLSSGALYYAAQLKKTVIGPKDGLIGKIIRKNKLGHCLSEISAQTIAYAIEQYSLNRTYPRSTMLSNSTIDNFNKTINENL